MLPKLHGSDLVAVRKAKSYSVGDVVAYHSPLIHRVVLHRIVKIRADGHYVLKGDNNSYLDPDHPDRDRDRRQALVPHPVRGRAVSALHVPWIVAAVAADPRPPARARRKAARRRAPRRGGLVTLVVAVRVRALVAVAPRPLHLLGGSGAERGQRRLRGRGCRGSSRRSPPTRSSPRRATRSRSRTSIAGVNGTAAANLLLGGPAIDVMAALGGTTASSAVAATTTSTAARRNDIAIGGPGNDIFAANCETQIP